MFQNLSSIIVTVGALISVSIAILKHKVAAVYFGAVFLMLYSLIVIIGYWLELPKLYTYPLDRTPMALPTAGCFFISGFVLLSVGFIADEIKKKNE